MKFLTPVIIEEYLDFELRIMKPEVSPSLEKFLKDVHDVNNILISYIGIKKNSFLYKISEDDKIIWNASIRTIPEKENLGLDGMLSFLKEKLLGGGRDNDKPSVKKLYGKYEIIDTTFTYFNNTNPINDLLTDKSKQDLEHFIKSKSSLKNIEPSLIYELKQNVSDETQNAISKFNDNQINEYYNYNKSSLPSADLKLLDIYIISLLKQPTLELIDGKKISNYSIDETNDVYENDDAYWYHVIKINSTDVQEVFDILKEIVGVFDEYCNNKAVLEEHYNNLLLDEKYEDCKIIKEKLDVFKK